VSGQTHLAIVFNLLNRILEVNPPGG